MADAAVVTVTNHATRMGEVSRHFEKEYDLMVPGTSVLVLVAPDFDVSELPQLGSYWLFLLLC